MPHSREACLAYLQQSIRRHRLERFFTDPQVVENIAQNAEQKLSDWRDRVEEFFSAEEMSEYAYSMLLLSLYQIHILLDDSGSMFEEDRIRTAQSTIRNIVDIDCAIIEKGIRLHLLNGEDPKEVINSVDDFNRWSEAVEYGGSTRLGTVLRAKIWSKIVEDPAKFARPCLVYVITDGEPTAEPRSALKESVLKCKNDLAANSYSPAAIAFGIVQVGTDEGAREFLDELVQIQELQDHLDVVNQNSILENHFRETHGKPKELESTLALKLLVGAIDRTGSS
ncbi:uncharacterized protein K444DRAFT_620558 [Hyaloscypha bicolor E]|uniref:VWFA domain-containing protein n=1 Tax=Hyaloscypha bicolor E TaxID=1095630 RepID=A0A2J6SL02_9HELO|nr:uncharacterized protein K444DRAFT_620558 [Hyaloscypha bicolor E]PMD51446.1 hypothetical protein K444DRAFT_620558 [Hyaloscypha bicolor E]